MRDLCPLCGSPMKRHGKRRLVALMKCYRDCLACDYRDKVTIEPERITKVEQLIRLRTNTGQNH